MSAYSNKVLADGATAYWRLDETSGLTAASQVGGYTGTISGGVTLNQPGALADGDAAMGFNGTTGYVRVPNGAYASWGTNPFSLECWVKPSASVSARVLVDTKNIATNGPGAALYLGSNGAAAFTLGGGAASLTPTTAAGAVTDGVWIHLVGTYVPATGTATIAINGAVVFTNAYGNQAWTFNSTNPCTIAASSAGTATLFTPGFIDDVAIYPTALTAAQISQHYALATTPLYIPGACLFDEDFMSSRFTAWTTITPSDTVDLVRATDGVFVGGAGDVAAVMQNGQAVALKGLPAGAVVPIVARRINATGTTATNLIALNQ